MDRWASIFKSFYLVSIESAVRNRFYFDFFKNRSEFQRPSEKRDESSSYQKPFELLTGVYYSAWAC